MNYEDICKSTIKNNKTGCSPLSHIYKPFFILNFELECYQQHQILQGWSVAKTGIPL